MKTAFEYLFSVNSPYIYVGEPEEEGMNVIPSYFYSKPSMNVCVRQLRGRKMRTTQELMNETGAAFQLFTGFGENWYALRECLEYLDEWMPADAYVIVVENSELLLDRSPVEEMTAFLVTLQDVGEWWSKPIIDNDRFNRHAVPFHVIFNISDGTQSSASRIICIAEKSGIPIRK